MRRIRRENIKIYKSSSGAIIHTDATSPDVIDRIATVPERNSTGCLTETILIGYVIIKTGDVVDVLPDTSPGNNILTGNGWVKEVEKFNNI